ncbi:MAG: transporter substrate-binding domain-containing protein [Clostridia bacterium]|nr:transporter substrate-binding domain-containing protein [Clostridia bacterium]
MKSFKRIAAILLAVLMAASLFACGAKTEGGDKPAPETAKKYVIASDNAFAPFEYLDTDTNQYVGIDMDILAAIAEDQKFDYEVQNVGFDAALNQVQSGQADAVIAGMTITDERRLTFDFSDGYFDAGQILVVPANSEIKSIEDLKGANVAVKISTQGADYAQSVAEQYGFTVTTYEDSPTMYQAVIQGTNAACFEDDPVARYSIQSQHLELKVVGDVINAKPYGFAAKLGENAELISMFNTGLANIKANGVYDQILAKYGY